MSQRITLMGAKGDTRRAPAKVFGVWAVHVSWRSLVAPGNWTLTHAPTGIASKRHIDGARAMRLARGLHRLLPAYGADLSLGEIDGIERDVLGRALASLERACGAAS